MEQKVPEVLQESNIQEPKVNEEIITEVDKDIRVENVIESRKFKFLPLAVVLLIVIGGYYVLKQ